MTTAKTCRISVCIALILILITQLGLAAAATISAVTAAENGNNTLNVSGIDIFRVPDKTSYMLGDTLDVTGLIIKIHLAEGGWLQGTVYEDMTFSPTKLDKAGMQRITVTYEGKTTTFAVNVMKEGDGTLNVSGIDILKVPNKTSYTVGDTLDVTGLILKLHLAEGGWLQGTVYEDMTFSHTKLYEAGVQRVTVTYEGKRATFTVTVTEKGGSQLNVTGIDILNPPNKTEYKTGETLDVTGLRLKVYLAEGGWLQTSIHEYMTFSHSQLNEIGMQRVTVTYEGKTTSFVIDVADEGSGELNISSIEIFNPPTKKVYKLGETFDPTGLIIRMNLAEGGWLQGSIHQDMIFTPTVMNSLGVQIITVIYRGQSTTLDVNVIEDSSNKLNVTGIEIMDSAYKKVYKVGETFNPEGLVFQIFLAEGNWLQSSDISDMTFAPTALNTVGTQKITATYHGKTASFDVTVTAADHVHSFQASYKSDNTQHWNECDCGERSNASAHTFGEWETVKAATETEEGSKKRACSVCGYEETEVIPKAEPVATDAATTPQETSATETSAPDTSEADTTPADPEKPAGYIPWWTVLIVAVAIAGIATVVIIVVLKKNKK